MQGARESRSSLQATCFFLLATIFLPAVYGQEQFGESLDASVPFENHLVRRWTNAEGLPSNRIRDVFQTQDGYIWIATSAGLARFDGHHFTVFNRARVAELPADDIRELYESRDGTLWIGSTAGLTRYKPGRPGVFTTIEALMGYHIEEIFEDRSGVMWIGTRTATWSAEQGGAFKLHATAPKHVMAFCGDRDGSFWLGSATEGLCRKQERGFVRVTAGNDATDSAAQNTLRQAGVNALCADDDGSLWIGTNLGLLNHNDGEFEIYTEGLNSQGVLDILQTQAGSLYVTAPGRLMRWDGDSLELLSGGSPASLWEDREGSLWVGETGGGVHQYRNNWTSLALPGQRALCVVEDHSGTLWFGTNKGLRRLSNGEVTSIVDGLPHPQVRTIAAGKDSLWIGTPKGLAQWSAGKITTVPGTGDLNIASVFEDTSGVLWIGLFQAGVYRLENQSLTAVPEIEGHVHWFHEDAGGVLWFGDDYGLRRQMGNHIERVRDQTLERLARPTLAHYIDGPDLWLASITGIARYRAGRFDVFTTREGLLAERIINVHGDNHGNLWMGTDTGYFYASLQALDDVAAGRAERVECHWIEQNYGPAEETRSFPKACRARDGTTWFAGYGSVLKVHAGEIPGNFLSPPVLVEQAKVNDSLVNANEPFEFLSGNHQVEINFGVPTFFRPQRVQVKYRLHGYDDSWIEAGQKRTASYANLRPRSYEFQVIADNGDGVWNETGDSLRFRVTPRWFETLWIRAAGLLFFVGALIGIYRWRLKVIGARHEEQRRHQEELNRASRVTTMGQLAASIAHEVNQPLCAILNDANSGLRLMSDEEIDVDEAKETFQDIGNAAQRASDVIAHIRELLSKHLTERVELDVAQLLQESLHLVRPELSRKRIQINVDIEPELPNVLGDHVQLQQVLINLVLNAADSMERTDSGPRVVQLWVSGHSDHVDISIRDSGAGIDPDKNIDKLFEPFYTTKPEGIGMGLAITRSIVDAHEGKIRAERNSDRGATFVVTLPTCSGNSIE